MLELARLNSAGLDEAVDVLDFYPDYPSELIGRQVPFVNEPLQAAQGDPQAGRGLLGPEPFRLVAH